MEPSAPDVSTSRRKGEIDQLMYHAGHQRMRSHVFAAGLIISILVLGACRSGRPDDEYFGRVSPPSERRLRFEHLAEPESLDLPWQH
jgi:hypothetical protein